MRRPGPGTAGVTSAAVRPAPRGHRCPTSASSPARAAARRQQTSALRAPAAIAFAAPSPRFGSPPRRPVRHARAAPRSAHRRRSSPGGAGACAGGRRRHRAPRHDPARNGWKIGVGIAGVVVLVAVVLRRPVRLRSSSSPTRWLPDTLAGHADGSATSRTDAEIRNAPGRPDRPSSSSGSDGEGGVVQRRRRRPGTCCFAVRGGSDAGSGSGDGPVRGLRPKTEHGRRHLLQRSRLRPRARLRASTTCCMHGVLAPRRVVVMAAMRATPRRPVETVAQATDEALGRAQ